MYASIRGSVDNSIALVKKASIKITFSINGTCLVVQFLVTSFLITKGNLFNPYSPGVTFYNMLL